MAGLIQNLSNAEFGWPLALYFFARKDGQNGQYNEDCDLIGKGDGQEIVHNADK